MRAPPATTRWCGMGFFQVINHGVLKSLLEEAIDGSRRFFEQETEARKGFYTRDFAKRVIYNSNMGLYNSVAADWRDSLFCFMGPEPPQPKELPEACR
ncbi:hypothetical protein NL676_007160 [Syzygium grande]|nr:hypothetical protein NL676_007160 [Syzygium grande]